MGMKPLFGLAGLFVAGVALTGCQTNNPYAAPRGAGPVSPGGGMAQSQSWNQHSPGTVAGRPGNPTPNPTPEMASRSPVYANSTSGTPVYSNQPANNGAPVYSNQPASSGAPVYSNQPASSGTYGNPNTTGSTYVNPGTSGTSYPNGVVPASASGVNSGSWRTDPHVRTTGQPGIPLGPTDVRPGQQPIPLHQGDSRAAPAGVPTSSSSGTVPSLAPSSYRSGPIPSMTPLPDLPTPSMPSRGADTSYQTNPYTK